MKVLEQYAKVRNSIPDCVRLVVVSKFKPLESIDYLFNHYGHFEFGESRAQEFVVKATGLDKKIHWHFIGHLQTNKIRAILPFCSLIQSVDSFRLLSEINREAQKLNLKVPVLLQFFIATEETKYGLSLDEACHFLESKEYKLLNNVDIQGVMGMASLTKDQVRVRQEFKTLRSHFEFLRKNYFMNQESFREVSMGMSGDYKLAIEEGSTMVRIGSLIFGE
jgi:pyridoxal phosphate enzyme (YggS family)